MSLDFIYYAQIYELSRFLLTFDSAHPTDKRRFLAESPEGKLERTNPRKGYTSRSFTSITRCFPRGRP